MVQYGLNKNVKSKLHTLEFVQKQNSLISLSIEVYIKTDQCVVSDKGFHQGHCEQRLKRLNYFPLMN